MLAGWRLALTGELWRNMGVSFCARSPVSPSAARWGSHSGSPTGFRVRSEIATDTLLQMVRNVPHLALIPLVILWFGIEETAKIFLVVLGVFFPIYINTLHGIRTVDPQLIEMGRIYGMTRASCSGA